MKKAQDRHKKYADQRRRDLEVQVEDEVLLSTKTFPVSVELEAVGSWVRCTVDHFVDWRS